MDISNCDIDVRDDGKMSEDLWSLHLSKILKIFINERQENEYVKDQKNYKST